MGFGHFFSGLTAVNLPRACVMYLQAAAADVVHVPAGAALSAAGMQLESAEIHEPVPVDLYAAGASFPNRQQLPAQLRSVRWALRHQ